MQANYLRGVGNPFDLVPPPAGWLNEMRLFDDRLVLFPSQKRATFILARRATRSAGEPLHDVKGLTQNPDTLIMHRHRLVRVCEILPGVIWDMRVFMKLAAHDIQRLGGAGETANKLDAIDKKRRDDLQKTQEDEVAARAADAYKAYKFQIGERISMAPNPHGRGLVKKKPVSVHVRPPQPAPSGPLIVAP